MDKSFETKYSKDLKNLDDVELENRWQSITAEFGRAIKLSWNDNPEIENKYRKESDRLQGIQDLVQEEITRRGDN